MAWNFFDKNGKYISIKETQKITSADIESFKKSTTVLVAGGRQKISQIKSVLKSGLFTGLITDEETAKQLWNKIKYKFPFIQYLSKMKYV